MERVEIVIVAAGKGARFGQELPKQFQLLDGIPILARSIDAMHRALPDAGITVALSPEGKTVWNELCARYDVPAHRRCNGGPTRFHTVQNALEALPDCDIILVHDAARPLVTQRVVDEVMAIVRRGRASVPVIPCVNSLRFIVGNESVPMDRVNIRMVQTPQAFPAVQLREAYKQLYHSTFTDDATVVENIGFKVSVCQGDDDNIKITCPMDLRLAEYILEQRK